MKSTIQLIKEHAEKRNLKPEKLGKLYRQHQKTPHEVIGFEEYQLMDDDQIFHDGRRYFIAYMEVAEWEHEIKAVMDEAFDEDLSFEYVKALQSLYNEKASRQTNQDLNDIETRWIIFDKTRLDELLPGDTVDFQYVEPKGGGCFKVQELHDEEIWLDGNIENGVLWKPHQDGIAEETKEQELKNFIEIKKIYRSGEQ